MSPSDFLLNDLFTLLSFLRTHDHTPRRTRFLDPRVAAHLASLMFARAPHDARRHKQTFARRPRTELQTPRVRWVHFLAEASGLLVPTHRALKPTIHFAKWLNSSSQTQIRTLFDAAFPMKISRAQFDLWRAYKLPASKFDSQIFLQPFRALMQELPALQTIHLSTLIKLLALPTYESDDPDQQPLSVARALLALLHEFDAITWHGRAAFEITAQGDALFHHKEFSAPESFEPIPLAWHKPRNPLDTPILYASQNISFHTLIGLAQYAELESVHPRSILYLRRYRLDSALIHRALDHGRAIADVRALLEKITAAPLPSFVNLWLDAITRHYGEITIRRATLLQVKDPAHLAELARAKQVRACFQKTLSPRAVIVKPTHLTKLIRRLEWRGEQPRLEITESLSRAQVREPNPPILDLATGKRTQHFENPTLAHLALSARLIHHLADVVPTQLCPPYSIVLELEQNLTPHDHETINTLIEEFDAARDAQQKARPHPSLQEISERDLAPAIQNVESNLSLIETALAHNTPFQMIYYSPYTNETTTRIVEPFRIEYRGHGAPGNVPYLIAFCRLDQAERTFRVDRILEINPADKKIKREKQF